VERLPRGEGEAVPVNRIEPWIVPHEPDLDLLADAQRFDARSFHFLSIHLDPITRAAVAVGDLTPAEASELGKLVEAYVNALEATDFAERLDKLERMTNR
jgi:hypothetical protein